MSAVAIGWGTTAFTVGTGATATAVSYGTLISTVAMGAAAYSATQQPKPGDISFGKATPITDKTTPQQAEQLDAAALGDAESEKRKRKSAKEKFKIKKSEEAVEIGVSVESDPNKVTGVQL